MKLKFTNSEEDLVFSDSDALKSFTIKISPYKRRIGIQKRYGKDGGVATGDQHVDARNIKIAYSPAETSDTNYLDAINEIIGFFNISLSPFYLVDTENSRRCEIVLSEMEDEPAADGTEWRIGKNLLSFKMLDGHWEDLNSTTVASNTGGMVSGDNISVNNSADTDCYPVFRISPYETNTEFTIKNLTTGALFTLGSNTFILGTEFEIDCQNGTIYLTIAGSRVELSSALADGSGFIKLVPGVNQIEYTSSFGEIDIEIEFRKRYAF